MADEKDVKEVKPAAGGNGAGGNGAGLMKEIRDINAELVTKARKEFANVATWLNLDPAAISADTPIPFNLNQVWYELDYDNNATYSQAQGKGEVQVDAPGDAAKLRPTRFKPYAMGSTAPFKGPKHQMFGTAPDRMRVRLLDPRFRFLLEPKGEPEGEVRIPADVGP